QGEVADRAPGPVAAQDGKELERRLVAEFDLDLRPESIEALDGRLAAEIVLLVVPERGLAPGFPGGHLDLAESVRAAEGLHGPVGAWPRGRGPSWPWGGGPQHGRLRPTSFGRGGRGGPPRGPRRGTEPSDHLNRLPATRVRWRAKTMMFCARIIGAMDWPVNS